MKSGYLKNNRIMMGISILALSGSLLAGCGKSDPLSEMFKSGEQIEISVYEPEHIQDEQGEQDQLIWEQLALLSTNPNLRKSWDNTLGIIGSQESKNGILYVNEAGEQDINNTLRVALHNTEFQKILSASASDSTLSALANAAVSNYADLEINDGNNRNEVMKAIYMAINGYFNLLPDNVPNYCNADSTLTRAQFMAMVFRADNPVQELESDGVFTNIVGASEYNIYAQGVASDSYLDLEYKGLNPQTYNSNITRGEVIYLLVSHYYSNELQLVDIKNSGVTFSDCTNAGNIAADQKVVKDATTKDYWKSYELAYALQNADDGMPEEMYRAMVVAQQNGLIGSETRWDEACTLSEAIELLVKAILNEKGFSNYTAKLGTMNTGFTSETEVEDEVYDSIEDVVAEPSDMDAVINSYDDNLAEEVTDPVEGVVIDYEVIPVTPMTLYATQTVNLRQGPSADDFAKIGSLSPRQQVTVVGEVREYKGKSVYWWQLSTGEFVSAAYLSEKPIPESSTGTGGTGTTEQAPEAPAPGTQMPGGITWGGRGGGELPTPDDGGLGTGIEWQ